MRWHLRVARPSADAAGAPIYIPVLTFDSVIVQVGRRTMYRRVETESQRWS